MEKQSSLDKTYNVDVRAAFSGRVTSLEQRVTEAERGITEEYEAN